MKGVKQDNGTVTFTWEWVREPHQTGKDVKPLYEVPDADRKDTEARITQRMKERDWDFAREKYFGGRTLGPNIKKSAYAVLAGLRSLGDAEVQVYPYGGRLNVVDGSALATGTGSAFDLGKLRLQEATFGVYYMYWLEKLIAAGPKFMKSTEWHVAGEFGAVPTVPEIAMMHGFRQWATETEEGRKFAAKAGIVVGAAVATHIILKKLGVYKALKRLAVRQIQRALIRRYKKRAAKILAEAGEDVAEAIKKARRNRLVRGRKGDCETGAQVVTESLGVPYKRHAVSRGSVHMVVKYRGRILDPTAAQYVTRGSWSWKALKKAGLRDAVKTGVFTEKQHELFMKVVTEAAR